MLAWEEVDVQRMAEHGVFAGLDLNLALQWGEGHQRRFSDQGRHGHYVPWRPFVLSVLTSRIKVEAAPGIVHLPLVFLNKHVIETVGAYGDRGEALGREHSWLILALG